MQIFIYCKATLHVSGVTAPIIRSIKNCTRSLRYRSYYLYRYSPPTWSDRSCNSMQIFIYCKATLHVSGVTAPIIRSIKNCTRSLRYGVILLVPLLPSNMVWSGRSPDQTMLEGSSGTSSMTCTRGCGYSF